MKTKYLLAMLLVVIGLVGTTLLVAAGGDEDGVIIDTALFSEFEGSGVSGNSTVYRASDGFKAVINITDSDMAGHAATMWVIINNQPAFHGTGAVFSEDDDGNSEDDDGNGTATFLIKVDKKGLHLKPKEDTITFKMKDHGVAVYPDDPDDPGFDQLLQLTTKNVICDDRGCPTVGSAVHPTPPR